MVSGAQTTLSRLQTDASLPPLPDRVEEPSEHQQQQLIERVKACTLGRASWTCPSSGRSRRTPNARDELVTVDMVQLKPLISGVFRHLSLVLCCERQL